MAAYYTLLVHSSPVVLTLADARLQTKTEDLQGVDDALVNDCIDAAIDDAEGYINSNIRERKFAINFSEWPVQGFQFREQILQSIDAIKYKDAAGEVQTLNVASTAELLRVDKYAKKISFLDYDNLPGLKTGVNDAVTIEVTAGYADGTVPKGLLQAIKLLVSDNYDFRGDREKKGSGQLASRRKLEKYKYYR